MPLNVRTIFKWSVLALAVLAVGLVAGTSLKETFFPTVDRGNSAANRQAARAQMHSLGVKKARAVVGFLWHTRPSHMKVFKVMFFDGYGEDCTQITDDARLARIRASSLNGLVSEFALAETASAVWSNSACFDSCGEGKYGVSKVDLMDDETRPSPNLVIRPSPMRTANDLHPEDGDELETKQFLASPASTASTRNDALLRAPIASDDSCIVKMLIRAGADVDARGDNENTPLMNAADGARWNDLRALLAAGANVNVQDFGGETALIQAAHLGDLTAVKILLEAGADPRVVSKSGETALDLALKWGHPQIADLIRRFSVRPAT